MKYILILLALISFSGCKSLTMTQDEWRQDLKNTNINRMREENPNVERCADIVLKLKPFTEYQAEKIYLPKLGVYNENNVAQLTTDLNLAESFVNKVDSEINNWEELSCNEGLMSAHIYEEIQYRTNEDLMEGSSVGVTMLVSEVKDMKKNISIYQARIEYLNSPEYKKRIESEKKHRQKAASEELHRSGYLDDISPYSTQETGPRYARCYYMSEFLGFTNTHFVSWALRTMDKAYFKRQLNFVNKYLTDVSPVTEEQRLDKASRYFGRYCR